MSNFNHFHNKIVYAPKHTYHTNFIHRTPKQLLFRGEYLFVRKKRHVRFRSVFFSHQVMVYRKNLHI